MMRDVFEFGSNTLVQLTGEDDSLYPDQGLAIWCGECNNLYAAIGLFFHYNQQQSGELFLNGIQIGALSMAQTCGASVAPCDYVEVGRNDFLSIQVKRLSELISGPICLTRYYSVS